MTEGPNQELLKITLSAAVPLWIDRVRSYDDATRLKRASICAEIVASKGDLLMFRSKTKGGSAEAFNALAEGLAIMAFAPGGVKVFGLHFEAQP